MKTPFEQDTRGRGFELPYFRDVDGREVDSVVAEKGRPRPLVECEWDDAEPGRSLRYLKLAPALVLLKTLV